MSNFFPTDQKRDTEFEIINKKTASITPERGLVVSFLPPESIELTNTVEVSPYCRSVHTYKGVTYAGCGGGVDRIDENNKVTKLFISIKDEGVMSISIHNDRIYTLSSDSTVRVHDLEGRSITSWTHTDISSYWMFQLMNQFAIIGNHIAIPNRVNETLVVYSLNGEVVNTLSCPLLISDALAHLSAADNNSIIISQPNSSLVSKVDISSGDIIWQCKDLTAPCGVTCYRDEFVLVADVTKFATFCVLSLHTG